MLSMLSSALKPLQFRAFLAALPSEPSFGDDLRQFLDGDIKPLDKRLYTATRQMISYTWAPELHQTGTGFNISMDISRCNRALKRHTIAGIYTHSNGTTANQATVGDLLDDLRAIRGDALTPQLGERAIMKHVLVAATRSRDRTNSLLDGGLICKSPSANVDNVHNELRRLLWYSVPDNVKKHIWEFSILLGTSSIAGTVAGLSASGVTALAVLAVDYRSKNGQTQYNKTLTPRELRNEIIVAGVATFLATVAADIAADIRARITLPNRVKEAVPAAIFLAKIEEARAEIQMAVRITLEVGAICVRADI
ncbi:hypothetical protein XPA_010029 [Xanthoria parietina]